MARLWFGLFGGPLAWSLEAMTAWALLAIPCPPGGDPEGEAAYRVAAISVCVLCVLMALAALLVARRSMRDAAPAENGDVMTRAAQSRVRFMAETGVFVSSVFLVATALTAAGPIVFPPCS